MDDTQSQQATESGTSSVQTPEDRNRRLAEQVVEIASLAGGLAHEIKNPLSTIRLSLDLLVEDLHEAESPRDRRMLQKIRVIQEECRHLQEILDDFLRFAHVKDLHLEATDLNDLVEELIDFFLPQAAQHSIEVLPYLESDLPAVELDRDLFQQALMNLLLNAEQAMPDGGRLTLITSRSDAQVVLEVIDNGCGMDAEAREQAFRPFYTSKSGGSGLGLPTTRKIVEAHGGTIQVESAVGKGTRFTITLPIPED